MDELLKRLDSIIDRVERDEPVDFTKEARLLTLDAVRSHVRYAHEAIQRTKDADGELNDGRANPQQ